MKNILLVFLIAFAASATAQETSKPPKLRINSGFFTTKYELGDKDIKPKEVRTHLEKTSPEAYYLWRKSESATTSALIFAVAGLGGAVYGLTAKDNTNKAAGFTAAATFELISMFAILSASARQEKAVDTYNKKFGY